MVVVVDISSSVPVIPVVIVLLHALYSSGYSSFLEKEEVNESKVPPLLCGFVGPR